MASTIFICVPAAPERWFRDGLHALWTGPLPRYRLLHQGPFPSVTLTFNLAPNTFLWETRSPRSENMQNKMGLPGTIHASFQGTAQAFQDSLASQPYLILAALITVYIVLGILYENYIHPITILIHAALGEGWAPCWP